MEKIDIQFTLFSAFYTPLIITMAGGFLKQEGLEPNWSVAPAGTSAIDAIENGTAHVIQSAPSQGFNWLKKGETPTAIHFAQVNEMDGFFIVGREADDQFDWHQLEGAEVVMFAGGQPNDMFRFACHKAGIDYDKIIPITPGGPAAIDETFRSGKGRFVQQQGPYPQQLEADSLGHVVAQVGPQIGPCAFSSLAASRDWLSTDMAAAFTRAYAKARHYLNDTPAKDVAQAEKDYFPDTELSALTQCIERYQALGCWTPHVNITPEAWEVTLDVYEYTGGIKERYDYNAVCALPPA